MPAAAAWQLPARSWLRCGRVAAPAAGDGGRSWRWALRRRPRRRLTPRPSATRRQHAADQQPSTATAANTAVALPDARHGHPVMANRRSPPAAHGHPPASPTPGALPIIWPPNWAATWSEYAHHHDKANHKNGQAQGPAHSPSRFSMMPRARLAVAVEQEASKIEPHAARDDRQHDEQAEVEAGKPRSDGHDLVGDRGQPLEQDDPGAVMRIGGAERLDLVAVAVEPDQPLPTVA